MRACYVQDPKTLELVPRDEYYARRAVDAPMVMPDIAGYKSMATGEWIGGRRQHREHLKEHGLIEIGNEVKAHLATGKREHRDPTIKQHLAEAVRRHMG